MARGKLQPFGSTTYPTALNSTSINFGYNSSLEFDVEIYGAIAFFSICETHIVGSSQSSYCSSNFLYMNLLQFYASENYVSNGDLLE
jgi:hypothetical protein